jgi:hypothetical protein
MVIRIFFFLSLLSSTLHAQAPERPRPWEHKQVQFFIGFSVAQLRAGQELLRAKDLRDQGLSYGETFGNERKSVGEYPSVQGGNFGIRFLVPIKRVKRLMLGGYFRGVMTGVNPEAGDSEGYYFNSISLGASAKYYPFAKCPIALSAEGGMGGILTKNRFVDDGGVQRYHHQYGIGNSAALGLAYFFPIKGDFGVELLSQYQWLNIRTEVDNIGSDNWRAGLWNNSVILNF